MVYQLNGKGLVTHLLRIPYSENRHAGYDAVGVFLGSRVDGIVGSDYQHKVSLWEVIVDLLHLQHHVIRHTSLC